eukprot:3423975-Rhodomonas_salina.1
MSCRSRTPSTRGEERRGVGEEGEPMWSRGSSAGRVTGTRIRGGVMCCRCDLPRHDISTAQLVDHVIRTLRVLVIGTEDFL